MTKISFDVDFSEDPEKILQQIQDRAKAEVEKRESKERVSGYLSKLHEKVNEDINTEYKSATDLIKALTPFASPALKDKLSSTSPSGRRKTVSMNKDVFDEIKKLLAEPNPNKAAIGRDTGVSVVQVRKVAAGGYDEKFGDGAPSTPANKEEGSSPETDLPPPSFGDEDSADEPPAPPAPDLPEPPSFGDDESADEPPAPPAPDLPEPPSFGEDEPPAPPAPDLPEPPSFGDDEPPAPPAPDLPEPPSFGDDEPPAPPAPDLPEPPSFGDDEPPAPPAPDLPKPPSFGGDKPPAPPAPGKPGLTRPPSLGAGKPTLKTGKSGKPSLSLKKGKSKTKGMKITRPPTPGTPPPPDS